MKNKKMLLLLTILLVSLFNLSEVFAGNASVYKMTVQAVQLKTSTGSWITIASPNTQIDVAGVSANAIAGSILTNSSIPVGEYVNFKLRMSETMIYSGTDGAAYTKSGGAITLTGDGTCGTTDLFAADPPISQVTLTETAETYTAVAAEQGEVTATLNIDPADGDDYIEVTRKTDLTTPISVKSDSEVSMYFDFDVNNTVHYVALAGLVFYTPPQSGTKFGITVDGVTTTTTEADMRIEF
jgi:hypothetical protein